MSLVEFTFRSPTEDEFEYFVCVYEAEHDLEGFALEAESMLEMLFEMFNGSKNPLNNQQEFIKKNNLYTSMSVGCIISINDVKYAVKGFGFEKLTY